MAPPTTLLLCTSLLLLTAVPAHGHEIGYQFEDRVPDTSGSYFFLDNFGVDHAMETLRDATALVWSILKIENFPENTNNFTDVHLILDTWNSTGNDLLESSAAVTVGNQIQMNADYMQQYAHDGSLVDEIAALLYHETTHIWQREIDPTLYTQETKAIVEGTADFVAVQGGHPRKDCKNWKLDESDTWYTGYCPTAFFFLHLTDVYKPDLVAQLNLRIYPTGYQDGLFQELIGADPETLWEEYIGTPTGLRSVGGGTAGAMLADGMVDVPFKYPR